jgi:protein TonB
LSSANKRMTGHARLSGDEDVAVSPHSPWRNFATLDGVIARTRDPARPPNYPAGENIVPLIHRCARVSASLAPEISVSSADRPAPFPLHNATHRQLAITLLTSLALHAGLYAMFTREPTVMASIAEEAITVEIVVGANSAAGTADVPSAVEVESRASLNAPQPDTKEAREEPPPEPERTAPPAPQDLAAVTPTEESIAPIQREIPPPEQKTEEQPPEPKLEEPKPKPSIASAPAANSVGRGRMAGDANYQGLVAARLARFKRFPPDARKRREQGSAVVSFGIDSAGRVTSVRLVRKTGFVALDHEVEAMVWRASPFPAPPTGVALNFSAPVSFHLN